MCAVWNFLDLLVFRAIKQEWTELIFPFFLWISTTIQLLLSVIDWLIWAIFNKGTMSLWCGESTFHHAFVPRPWCHCSFCYSSLVVDPTGKQVRQNNHTTSHHSITLSTFNNNTDCIGVVNTVLTCRPRADGPLRKRIHCSGQSREIKDRGQRVLEIGKHPSSPFERVAAMKICNINKAVDALKAKAFLPGPVLCGGNTHFWALALKFPKTTLSSGSQLLHSNTPWPDLLPVFPSRSAQLLVTFAPSPSFMWTPPSLYPSYVCLNTLKQDPIISLMMFLWQGSAMTLISGTWWLEPDQRMQRKYKTTDDRRYRWRLWNSSLKQKNKFEEVIMAPYFNPPL